MLWLESREIYSEQELGASGTSAVFLAIGISLESPATQETMQELCQHPRKYHYSLVAVKLENGLPGASVEESPLPHVILSPCLHPDCRQLDPYCQENSQSNSAGESTQIGEISNSTNSPSKYLQNTYYYRCQKSMKRRSLRISRRGSGSFPIQYFLALIYYLVTSSYLAKYLKYI